MASDRGRRAAAETPDWRGLAVLWAAIASALAPLKGVTFCDILGARWSRRLGRQRRREHVAPYEVGRAKAFTEIPRSRRRNVQAGESSKPAIGAGLRD